jgi:hypothetical protein
MAVMALGRGGVQVVAVTVEGGMEAGGWPGTLEGSRVALRAAELDGGGC